MRTRNIVSALVPQEMIVAVLGLGTKHHQVPDHIRALFWSMASSVYLQQPLYKATVLGMRNVVKDYSQVPRRPRTATAARSAASGRSRGRGSFQLLGTTGGWGGRAGGGPITNHQPPPTTTSRHQPPVASRQPPNPNRQPPPNPNRQSPPIMNI